METFAFDVKKTKDDLASYVNAKTVVSSYVTALTNTDISGVTFKDLPSDLKKQLPEDPNTILTKLKGELKTAQGHGMTWLNDIEPDLTKIPQAIINYNTQFQKEYNVMMPLIDALIDNPKDAKKRKELTDLFKGLLKKLNTEEQSIVGEMDLIKQFNTDIHGDSLNFSSANKDFDAIRTWEEENLKTLKKALANIETAIKGLTAEVTATAIAAGVSLAVIGTGLVLIATGGEVKPIIGAVVCVVGMVGVGLSVAFLITSINNLVQEESEKSKDELEISLLTQQVTALDTVEKVTGGLVDKSQEAAQAVQIILDTWGTLKVKLEAVINDLESSEEEIGNIMSKVDLQTAQAQWNQLQDFAEAMQQMKTDIDDKKNTSDLEIKKVCAA
jgi:predicted  nucleic acid-binding Zn-ribbon protein